MKQICKDDKSNNCDNSSHDNVLVSRTAVVDTKFGDDETAQLENLNYPFETIKAAFKAIKRFRESPNESWNVILRLGTHKLDVPIPNKIILAGLGQGTILHGKLRIRGHAEIIALSLVSDELPIIEVNTKQKYQNAIVLLTGLDVFNNNNLNSPKHDKNEVRVAIRINSNAVNSTTIIKDCRLTFLFDRLNLGENKFILVSNARLNILTSIIRASGSSAVRNYIVENTNGSVDVELGATLFTSSSNQLSNHVAFYVNSSSNPMLINSNRVLYTVAHVIPNPTPIPPPIGGIPNAVIYALVKDQGVIFSRFALADIQNVLPENFIVAFTASSTSKISVLEFSTLNEFAGEVRGLSQTSPPDVKFLLSANGNTLQSGAVNQNAITINPGDPSPFLVTKLNHYITVATGVSEFFVIQFPDPTSTDISTTQEFQIYVANDSVNVKAAPFDGFLPSGTTTLVKLIEDGPTRYWSLSSINPPPP